MHVFEKIFGGATCSTLLFLVEKCLWLSIFFKKLYCWFLCSTFDISYQLDFESDSSTRLKHPVTKRLLRNWLPHLQKLELQPCNCLLCYPIQVAQNSCIQTQILSFNLMNYLQINCLSSALHFCIICADVCFIVRSFLSSSCLDLIKSYQRKSLQLLCMKMTRHQHFVI